MDKKLSLALMTACMISLSQTLPAQTVTSWLGTSSDWDLDANWDNLVPNAGVDALFIADGGSIIKNVTLAVPGEAGSLLVDAVDYTLQISGSSSDFTLGHLSVNYPFTLFMDSTDAVLTLGVIDANNANLVINTSANVSSDIAIHGPINISGSAVVEINTGANGSVIYLNRDAASLNGANILLSNSETRLQFDSANLQAISTGTLSGNGSVVIVSGSATLSGNNTYSGGTNLLGGTLISGNDSAFGNGAMTVDGVATISTTTLTAPSLRTMANEVVLNSLANLTIDSRPGNITLSGNISSSGDLTLAGGKTIILEGNNSYSGQTYIKGSTTISLESDTALGNSSIINFIENGTIKSDASALAFEIPGQINIAPFATATLDTSLQDIHTVNLTQTITGSGDLVKAGSGNLSLFNSSDLSGRVLVTGGNLVFSDSATMPLIDRITLDGASTLLDVSLVTDSAQVNNLSGSGNVVLGSKTLHIVQSYTPTFDPLSGVISGIGGNIVIGDGSSLGPLVLSGVNTYSGNTVVNSGKLLLVGSGSIADSSSVTLNGSSLLDISALTSGTSVINLSGSGNVNLGSNNLDILNNRSNSLSGSITGTGQLSISGSYTFNLSGTNSYSGGTVINSIVNLNAGSTSAFGSSLGQITFANSGTITTSLSQGYTFINNINVLTGINANFDATGGNLDIPTTISGAGLVVLLSTNSNSIKLSGNNSYLGNTIINSDTLNVVVGSNQAFGNSSSTIVLSTDANLKSAGVFTIVNAIDFANNSLNVDTTSGDLTLAGSLIGIASSALNKNGNNKLILSAPNTAFLGDITINQGSLYLLGSGSIANATSTTLVSTVAPFAFDISQISASSTTVNDLSGVGAINLGTKQLNLNFTQNLTLSSSINGFGGSLQISGSGNSTISGNSTYTGGTILNGNTVTLGSDSALGVGIISFNADTTLATTSARNIGNDLNLLTSTFIANTTGGNITLSGDISGLGNVTKSGSNWLILQGTNTFTGNSSVTGGTLALSQNGSISQSERLILAASTVFDISAISGSSTLVRNIQGAGNVVLGSKNLTINQTETQVLGGIVSGNLGSLTIYGGGVLTLSGSNTYTGNTSLLGSTTVVPSNANSFGSSSSTIIFLEDATIAPSIDYTFVNPISIKAGAVATLDNTNVGLGNMCVIDSIISGPGTLALRGDNLTQINSKNSYQGGTLINGAVEINNPYALGIGGKEITLAGYSQILINSTNSYTFLDNINLNGYEANFDTASGVINIPTVIKGSGSISLAGDGTVTLSGQNTFAGDINGGVVISNNIDLQLGSSSIGSPGYLISGPLGTSYLSIMSPFTLIPIVNMTLGNQITSQNDFEIYTYSGGVGTTLNLTGSYSSTADNVTIAKSGSGELILSGNNFTSSFDATAQLEIGLGVVTLNSVNGLGSTYLPELIFDNTQNFLTLKVNINPDTLQAYTLNNDVTVKGLAKLIPQASLLVNGVWNFDVNNSVVELLNNQATFTTNITASTGVTGQMIKVREGAIFASNRSSLNPLLVDSSMIVYEESMLKGNISLAGDLDVQGIVAPGNSIGKISVAGNYVQSGFYLCELNRLGSSDLLAVIGSANLSDGTLTLIQDLTNPESTGYYIHDAYTILTASDGVLSQFDTVNQGKIRAFEVAPFNGSLVYRDNAVLVNLGSGLLSSAHNPNEFFIYNSLIALDPPTLDQQQLIDALIETPYASQLVSALSGEEYSNLMLLNTATSLHFTNALYNPIREFTSKSCSLRGCASNSWFDASAIASDYANDNNSYGFKSVGATLVGGIQSNIACNLMLGLGFFYEYDDITFKDAGEAYRHTLLGGVYALYRSKCFYVFADVNAGYNFGSLKRDMLGFSNQSNPKSTQLSCYAEFGFDMFRNKSAYLLQPFLAVNTTYSNWQAFVEKGDLVTQLTNRGRNDVEAMTRLGFHLYSQGNSDSLMAIDLDWAYRATNCYNYKTILFNNSSDSVYGLNLARSSFEASAYLSQKISCNLKAYIEGSTRIWPKAIEGSLLAGLSLDW